MAKNDFLDDLITAGSIVGGVWLATEFLKAFSKKIPIYHCPRCNLEIQKDTRICPKCGFIINWGLIG